MRATSCRDQEPDSEMGFGADKTLDAKSIFLHRRRPLLVQNSSAINEADNARQMNFQDILSALRPLPNLVTRLLLHLTTPSLSHVDLGQAPAF